jgi:hypothetical protein
MSDPKYLQDELEKRFDHLAEECGEFITAYAKMRRWGAMSYNPELPPEERTPNAVWVTNEMNDVFKATMRLLEKMEEPDSINKLQEAFPLYHE